MFRTVFQCDIGTKGRLWDLRWRRRTGDGEERRDAVGVDEHPLRVLQDLIRENGRKSTSDKEPQDKHKQYNYEACVELL